ncbi:MAG TPA: hypothetical protein VG755_24945 [Nannocystaceae bacterium]|nr:hypothetical protein [Nannocystaceae bacterium]
MRTAKPLLFLVALGALSCTQVELPPAGALAMLPTSLFFKPPPGSMCSGKPDLAVEAVTFAPATISVQLPNGQTANVALQSQAKACVKIKNVGPAAWSAGAGQSNISVASDNGVISGTLAGVTSLAAGAVVERCAIVNVPGLLKVGHEPEGPGKCPVSKMVTAKIVLDPDAGSDASTSNDDCLAKNNEKTVQFDYMYNASCVI